MGRSASSFNRKDPQFEPEKRILVLCEDSKSGKQYLEDAALYFRASLVVEVVHPGMTHPSGIVENAIKKQRKYDEIYCTIDRDTHKCFDRAIDIAKPHKKITIIASYPCFEFWLLLHFGFNRKPYSRTGRLSPGENAVRDLRGKPNMDTYDKGENISYFRHLLGAPFDEARRVAPKVLKDAQDSGQPNPSTTIHLLMDRFEELSEPQT